MKEYTLNQLVVDLILDYPLLYKDINYEYSRQKVLNHLFFVIGNGFTWAHGVLCPTTSEGQLSQLTNRTIPEDYFEKPIWSKEEDELQFFRKLRLEDGLPYKPREICSKYAIAIYPICKYANICNIPEDIRIDFHAGAMEAVTFALDFFEDPHKYMLSDYCRDWAEERKYDRIVKYVKEQKQFLYEAKEKLLRIKYTQ